MAAENTSYVLAIDLGTSGPKVALVSTDGDVKRRSAYIVRRQGDMCIMDNGEQQMKASEVSKKKPFKLLKGTPITIQLKGLTLEPGSHDLQIDILGKAAGRIAFDVSDEL